MSWLFAGRYFEDLRAQNGTTKLLQVPTSCTVHNSGTGTLATLYTDKTKTTAASNPVSTGVADNVAGISTTGNLLIFADPGDYDVTINGHTYTVPIAVDPADIAALKGAPSGGTSVNVLADGTTVGTQSAVNFIGLKTGNVVNNTGSGRIDVDLSGPSILWVASGDARTVNNQSTVSSGQTLSSLTFACEAGHTYFFDGAIYFSSTVAAGIKVQFAFPSGSTFRCPLVGASTGQGSFDVTSFRHALLVETETGPQQFAGLGVAVPQSFVNVPRTYLYTPTAGNIVVSFAQATATSVNTTVLDGSNYAIVDATP